VNPGGASARRAAVLRDAGDAAVLLQLEAAIEPEVNTRATAIAAVIHGRALAGVRDVVSTFRSVAVYFDPLLVDIEVIRAALLEAVDAELPPVTGRPHEIPVHYGGGDGPDLPKVAAYAGLSEAGVIGRHADREYRVYMLGFQPGFAYLGTVDSAIAMPRRATPRITVSAGSIGIAGRQTGIYPGDSPGGWQIIGRTGVKVFDAETRTALFAPGDVVRFVREADHKGDIPRPAAGVPPAATLTAPTHRRSMIVLRPGLFTTIQDAGRWGEQGIGVPVSGAMDRVSHAAANIAAGNPAEAAALEVTIAGPALRLEQPATIAIAGADLSARVDGDRLPLATPLTCKGGAVVSFGERVGGARAYVAVDGGIATVSRWPVTPLKAGDTISLGPSTSGGRRITVTPPPAGGARLRVLPGPQDDQLPADAIERLTRARFVIDAQSNRMGYRLTGAVLPVSRGGEMISDATFAGGIQVPPSGEPILLMADRQTTGGYPQLATVISADLPIAAQLAPGEWVEFAVCSRAEALAALRAQEAGLRG
jgi:KipI family sensor histidine kinase inhibitor